MVNDALVTAASGWLHLVLDVPRAGWGESIAFWSSVTGWAASDPYGELQQFVTLHPAADDAWLKLQALDGGPRVHLDLDTRDQSTAVECSIHAGARPAWRYGEVEVMRSPGGLLFCYTREDHPRRFARTDLDGVLDQVCLGIPAPRWYAELAFWQALTGRELEHGLREEFAFLGDPDPHGPLRILLQRLDSTDGNVRAHPDFAVADRDAQTARHVNLGAQVLNVMDRWTVMRAPDQHIYCLTDRDATTGRVRC